MDLSDGIRNVGDFYSNHYLESALAGDLKDVLQRWRAREEEGGGKTPAKRLVSLCDAYFQSRSQARQETDRAERGKLTREFHWRLLEALGYDNHRAARSPVQRSGRPAVSSQSRHAAVGSGAGATNSELLAFDPGRK